MAADITDKFSKIISGTTRPVATTLSAQKLSGATTASLTAATGWDTDTAVHGIMYRTDAGTGAKVAGSQIDWKATLSGTTLSNFTVTAGTDDTYAIGATVELAPTAAWGDDLVTGLLVSHDQDGTLKAGAVDVAAVLATDVVETAKIKDLNVTTAKIADGAVTPAKLLAGTGTDWVWQSWTPTLTNMTLGNGTVVAKYVQVGKTVHYTFKFTLGSTSAMSSSPEFSVPVTINSSYTDFLPIGHSGVFDNSTSSVYLSAATPSTTSKIRMFVTGASSTHAVLAGISSTVPMTWATSDILWSVGTYEAA